MLLNRINGKRLSWVLQVILNEIVALFHQKKPKYDGWSFGVISLILLLFIKKIYIY